jgi:glycolate oxidase FAD binding subunit
LIDWHGALRWLWAPLSAQAELQAVAREAGGRASAFVAPTGGIDAAAALRPESEVLQTICHRLKASFDPQGIFNPGLTPDANQTRA